MECPYCDRELKYLSDSVWFCKPCEYLEDENEPAPEIDPIKLAKTKKAFVYNTEVLEPDTFPDMDYGDYIRNIEVQANLRKRKKK